MEMPPEIIIFALHFKGNKDLILPYNYNLTNILQTIDRSLI